MCKAVHGVWSPETQVQALPLLPLSLCLTRSYQHSVREGEEAHAVRADPWAQLQVIRIGSGFTLT